MKTTLTAIIQDARQVECVMRAILSPSADAAQDIRTPSKEV